MAKVPKPEFYNFHDRFFQTRGIVNMNLLQSDVMRGVKHLNEEAYCRLYGSTNGSLFFIGALINLFGRDWLTATRAELTYNQNRSPELRVYTRTGYCLLFKGVSGGFYGEGPRGCHDILKLCGFNKEQCERPFKKETFTASKRDPHKEVTTFLKLK